MNKKKGWLVGCLGCLGIILLCGISFAACSVIFSGVSGSNTKVADTKVTGDSDEQKKKEKDAQTENQKAEQEEQEKAEAEAQAKKDEEAKKAADEDKAKEEAEKKKATKTAGTTDRIAVDLIQTVDGDTIKVMYNGKEETVRYLLIDTPETKDPNSCMQPFGQNASDRNKQLVNSEKLEIEFDVGERKDKYGRLLAYVYADGKSVQETLLKEGLARVAYVYPPNTRYLDQFQSAESSAKNNRTAIWSQSGYASNNGFNGCVAEKKTEPKEKPKPKPEPKAPASSNVYFKNCSAVKAAGAAPIHRGDPGYAKHLDRDGDGVGCES
ncbi:thermonuclease family protein [Bacillus gobiensis]|uniref:thermonuclease family protein n=1 Tax=Bacillus gobiensis TaxID=1441095 RepID=UPI003D1F9F08